MYIFLQFDIFFSFSWHFDPIWMEHVGVAYLCSILLLLMTILGAAK